MSLLDGRQVAKVEVATLVPNAYNGGDITYASPVSVRCSVQPLSSDEATALGIQIDTAYTVFARRWPGGPYSRVTWDGRQWFQHGEAARRRMGRATQHDRAIILAQTAPVA